MSVIQWAVDNDLNYLDPATSNPEASKFLWVDVETTGLDTHVDVVLEIGAVLTDEEGYPVAEPVHFLIKPYLTHPERNAVAMERMTEFVGQMHDTSGLWDDILKGPWATYAQASAGLINYVGENTADPKSIRLAGSSVGFDKSMLNEFMPEFINMLHYRVVDVSTLKELCRELNPDLYARLDTATEPKKLHRALPDLVDTLGEFAFYVDNFLYWGPLDA